MMHDISKHAQGCHLRDNPFSWENCTCVNQAIHIVHNHGPAEGPGLNCNERWVDGQLQGKCIRDAMTPPTYDDLGLRAAVPDAAASGHPGLPLLWEGDDT